MFLTVHATVGAIIGDKVSNPFLSFLLAIIFHFIFDMIPHGDKALSCFAKTESQPGIISADKFRTFVKAAAFDGGLVLILILSGFGFQIFKNPLSVAFGIVGGILPDIAVSFYYMVSKNIFLKKFEQIHAFVHEGIIKSELPLKIGILMQTIIAVILISIVIMY
jgi:hypothetical protein